MRASKEIKCVQMYIIVLSVLSFVSWTRERHLILKTAKRGIFTSKYGPKDLMLSKRASAFVSTEETLSGSCYYTASYVCLLS